MDAIIRVTSRVLLPLIMIFGIYLAVHGHLSPGGAFPAGVIIASGFAIVVLAFERDDEEYRIFRSDFFNWKNGIEMLVMIAIIMFGYMGLRGYLLGSQMPLELWSGGYTIFLNMLALFFIFTSLFMIIKSMVKE